MAIIAGRTGAGKTKLLFKILTTPNFLDYNSLIIFTSTTLQPVYQCLFHGFNNNLTKTAVASLYEEHEKSENEEDIEELCIAASQNKCLTTSSPPKVLLTNDPTKIPPPCNLPKRLKHCCVFDDCVRNKDQTLQNLYFTTGKHFNTSVFYLSQNIYGINTTVRRTANIFILFELDERSFTEILKVFLKNEREKFMVISFWFHYL